MMQDGSMGGSLMNCRTMLSGPASTFAMPRAFASMRSRWLSTSAGPDPQQSEAVHQLLLQQLQLVQRLAVGEALQQPAVVDVGQ